MRIFFYSKIGVGAMAFLFGVRMVSGSFEFYHSEGALIFEVPSEIDLSYHLEKSSDSRNGEVLQVERGA